VLFTVHIHMGYADRHAIVTVVLDSTGPIVVTKRNIPTRFARSTQIGLIEDLDALHQCSVPCVPLGAWCTFSKPKLSLIITCETI